MANYPKIIELRPEVDDFIRTRETVRFRGEVMAYPKNIACESFSTDGAGYRHSTLRGKSYSVAESLASRKYGLLLGASNNFGFGIAGNENTMSSLLAERFGFPFANVAMPGANSRNLYSLLVAFLARGRKRPSVVVHSTGGDLGGFSESALCDPVFGPPNRAQLTGEMKEASLKSDPERNVAGFLGFTGLWTTALSTLCRAYGIPFVLIHQSTFFEKAEPNAMEVESGLGEPFRNSQERQFANVKRFSGRFYAHRKSLSEKLGVPLAGWGLSDRLSFIDEFHLDREGMRTLTDAVGDAVEPLL